MSTCLYLNGLSRFTKNIVVSAFAQAIREAAFSSRNTANLVEGTVVSTVSYMAQAFRSNNRPDPRLDNDGKTCFILQEQFRGYKNTDGAVKKQRALPLSVLRKMMKLAVSDQEKASVWLLIGAIFFAMRSCEYLKTGSEESKRTKILRCRNIIFRKNGKLLRQKMDDIASADYVIITFEFQKNEFRNKAVHMYSTNDEVLDPVTAWARTINRLASTIPDFSGDTKVCEFFNGKKTIDIDSSFVRSKIRSVVDLIEEAELGFGKDDVGLHSIRSGGAMAMFLSGVNEINIQRVGRWKSDAFLEYIREQVDTFTVGVSQKMLKYEKFHHLNAKESELLDEYDDEDEELNGDGPIEIPFTVHYSKAIVESDPPVLQDIEE